MTLSINLREVWHPWALLVAAVSSLAHGTAEEATGLAEFHNEIAPVLENYCFDCHGDGASKGKVTLDEFENDQAILENRELWLHVLKNLRTGLMPPRKKSQPTPAEKQRVESWIKRAVFEADSRNPDPGRVTIRRLNRVEYQNTIRDLLGVEFDVASAFPPDDTGHGFDNLGDVLTLPPMLLEKYVVAAKQIITDAVPSVPRVVREQVVAGNQFSSAAAGEPGTVPDDLQLPFYQAASVTNNFSVGISGKYQLTAAVAANSRHVDDVFDLNKCRLIFRVDGKEMSQQEYHWAGGGANTYRFDVDWSAGRHELAFELQPLTPDEPQTRSLAMKISSVTVSGPMAQEHWVVPKDYRKYFPKDVPADEASRQAYAGEILGGFVRRAYRRPADEPTVARLVALAESVYRQPGKTFETGISQAMVAVLASSRFLFREERPESLLAGEIYPLVDEPSLASRLSYFLWSSMPDEELLRLAEAGELRKNLPAQVERMLKDGKSEAFISNFVGQWLRVRDIGTIPIEARPILTREEKFDPQADLRRKRRRELNEKSAEHTPAERAELAELEAEFRLLRKQPLRGEMNPELRQAMRMETEHYFGHLLRENRSLLEFLDSDYTFLNERLAKHYGIPDVIGNEMRLVKLPAGSPRGGILTQGSILTVTSNPTRTSPVKRGVFILDNILGTPPPPPPPNIPQLEDSAKNITGHVPALRETLALHRENPLCSSCHDRMDPLGLALENFNAMGMWRDQEYKSPVDATGQLITGEKFQDVRALKRILVSNHAHDFYTTVTEKLLTYALGRGLDYYDVETTDQIVAELEACGGRLPALITEVVNSAPFQRTRTASAQPLNKAVPQPIENP